MEAQHDWARERPTDGWSFESRQLRTALPERVVRNFAEGWDEVVRAGGGGRSRTPRMSKSGVVRRGGRRFQMTSRSRAKASRKVKPKGAEEQGDAVPFQLERLPLVIEPEPGNPTEAEGVLNPAAARGRDGALYLFPRLVARGNYSRIGIARVRFDDSGDPAAVERLGIALRPEEEYERRGCEDPRITYVEQLNRYVMTYTAFSDRGPRIALAVSDDLSHWRRLGLVRFEPHEGINFGDVNNKDALVFPIPVPNPSGRPSLALIHRPLFPGTEPDQLAAGPQPRTVDLPHESLWLSYCDLSMGADGFDHLTHYQEHHRLASPVAPWERVKVGGGAPPVRIGDNWLVLYHGVSSEASADGGAEAMRYSAGALVLDRHDPRVIRYRSPEPILVAETPEETEGVVANVVFPTGADRRLDLGQPNRIDVYYGMADRRIGVAKLTVPPTLPPGALADPHEGLV